MNGDHAIMEDLPQNLAVQLGSPSGGMGTNNKPNQDDRNQRPLYSIPGILHYIQHEWARFEMERSQWEVERAELQARVAFLQGERKGQENLKNDLIRRIKMLEFALKQERAKFHKLKYGADPNFMDLKEPTLSDIDEADDRDNLNTSDSNVSWKQGRQLLRQYLEEIGYTDTIIDVRSARVRTLLGIVPSNAEGEDKQNQQSFANGGQTQTMFKNNTKRRARRNMPGGNAGNENALLDAEQSVLDTFDFLSSENVDMDDDEDDISDEMDDSGPMDDEESERMEMKKEIDMKRDFVNSVKNAKLKGKKESVDGVGEPYTGEAVLDMSFLPSGGSDASEHRPTGENSDWGVQSGTPLTFSPGTRRPLMNAPGNEDDSLDAGLGLGELASLTVNNEADNSYDMSSAKEAFRKTWNAKYTLRSHFDGVRALAFHPVEPVLITASEDHTLKLWNLQKTVPAKKAASLDVEPVYTFRGHMGPVLCLALSPSGDQCYSGGMDGTIRCWNVPSSLSDPYDSFDPSVLTATLKGHSDAVWGLSIHSSKLQLLSCSADGTVRLWSPQCKVPLLHTYGTDISDGIPTSVDFLRCDLTQMVAAYTSSNAVIFDLETGKPVIRLDSNLTPDASPLSKQINCVVCHPTLPVTVTAHEDRHIRFFDNNTGKMIHSMVAHLDAVTSLAIDPNGLYLLSGSHDCSIRLWNMDNKTCVQEITSHRKKFDEAIFDVALHPTKPYLASAGADALAKVFV